MKVWFEYGSEHSSNLVMIGHFREVRDATRILEVLDQIREQVELDERDDLIGVWGHTERYPERTRKLLNEFRINTLTPTELEQFCFEFHADVDEDKVVITTNEYEVSAYLKVMVESGARVEVYSADNFPNSDYGRVSRS